MSASWECLRCKRLVGGGMPSFLVVPGNFRIEVSGRVFTVDNGPQETLCFDCYQALRKAVDEEEELEDVMCAECNTLIGRGENKVCRGCFDDATEEAAQPVSPCGLLLAV